MKYTPEVSSGGHEGEWHSSGSAVRKHKPSRKTVICLDLKKASKTSFKCTYWSPQNTYNWLYLTLIHGIMFKMFYRSVVAVVLHQLHVTQVHFNSFSVPQAKSIIHSPKEHWRITPWTLKEACSPVLPHCFSSAGAAGWCFLPVEQTSRDCSFTEPSWECLISPAPGRAQAWAQHTAAHYTHYRVSWCWALLMDAYSFSTLHRALAALITPISYKTWQDIITAHVGVCSKHYMTLEGSVTQFGLFIGMNCFSVVLKHLNKYMLTYTGKTSIYSYCVTYLEQKHSSL